MAMRWWYLTHLLFGQLVQRGQMPAPQALRVLASFVALRDMVLTQVPLDFVLRCEYYERALQDELSDEGRALHIYTVFQTFVGREDEILKEFYFASMMGVSNRLSKAVDRFEIVE